jgi:ketosteroid isomerase-like protein
MSQEQNLARVRRAVDIWNSGDLTRLTEVYAPDIVVHPPAGWPEPGPFTGVDAAVRELQRLAEDFGENHLDASGLEDRGDVVLARFRWLVRADHSGIEGEFRISAILRFREGKIVELRYYREDAEALEAIGDV